MRTWLSRLEFKTIEQDNYLAGIETDWGHPAAGVRVEREQRPDRFPHDRHV